MRHRAHRFLLVGAARDDTHADRVFAFVDAANRQDGWWSTPLRNHGSPPVLVGWMTKPEYAFDLVADLHLELGPARFHFVLRGAVELPAGMAARASRRAPGDRSGAARLDRPDRPRHDPREAGPKANPVLSAEHLTESLRGVCWRTAFSKAAVQGTQVAGAHDAGTGALEANVRAMMA